MQKYICLLFIAAFLIPAVAADGIAVYNDDNDRWNLRPETQQLAAINYEKGYENLLLSVTLDDALRGNRTVWIFPVPAKPEEVSIDILKGYPRYGGEPLDRLSGQALIFSVAASAGYATFPASLPVILMEGAGFLSSQKAAVIVEGGDGSVIVHEHIEKMGLATEIITARDGASVKRYIAGKGFSIPEDATRILDGYTGKDFSLVVSYAANETAFASGYQPDRIAPDTANPGFIGVFVRFPTDRIYFPLELTGVYGDRTIPVIIYTKGFVSPAPDEKIRPFTEVTYLIDRYYWYSYSAGDLEKFFNFPETSGPVKYTKVRITAPSRLFTGDLWMDPTPPPGVAIGDAIVSFPVLAAIPFYVILSMLGSIAAGIVVFGNDPASRKHLALHGLWNCGAMIGFACGTVEYLKVQNGTPKRKLAFFLLFYTIFIAACALAIALIEPGLITQMTWIGEFLVLLPFIGYLYAVHIFPANPVLAVILFGANATVYAVLWLAADRYLK